MKDLRHATMDDLEQVAALLDRCAAADGRPALSEFKALRVPVANGVLSLVATNDAGAAVAIAVAAWHPAVIGEAAGYWAAEIAIDPAERSVEAYAQIATSLEGDLREPMALWTFDDVQAEAAHAIGLGEGRAIVEMRRPLPAAAAEFPDRLTVRPFVVDQDETTWLVLNQKVFAEHPEAGSIDSADLALRMAQNWFDPNGLLIMCHDAEPVGYAWTKKHPGGVGEIYMIGLVPGFRGKGLARPLTLAGLESLADRGATTAMLYAEASNGTAIRLYESMEFKRVRRIALFEPAADQL